MERQKWLLRREESNEFGVEDIGIFGDLEAAFGFLKNMLMEEVEEMAEEPGYYDEWLEDHNYDRRQHSLHEYIRTQQEYINNTLNRIRRTINMDVE